MNKCEDCFGAANDDCQSWQNRIYNGQRVTDKELQDMEQEEFLRRCKEEVVKDV